MILPPPTDYLRAFALVFVAGFLSGLSLERYGAWKFSQGKSSSTIGGGVSQTCQNS